MKWTKCRAGSSVVCLLAASVSTAALADPLQAGTVKRVTGLVTVERGPSTMPVLAGMAVMNGDLILTGSPGAVGIVLVDDTLLTAGANSRLVVSDVRFDTTTYEGNVIVRLLKGALHVVTGLVARQAPQNVRVETPTAVMGVRGTEFIVDTRGTE